MSIWSTVYKEKLTLKEMSVLLNAYCFQVDFLDEKPRQGYHD